jgi:hypothetical protein
MPWIRFTREHGDIPIYVVSIYMFMVFVLPTWLDKGYKMRKRFVAWNLLLSLFSWAGATRVVPTLYKALRDKGFRYTVCADPKEW